MKQKILKIIVLVLIAGFIGYAIGTAMTIKIVASIAMGFVDPLLIEEAVLRYRNNLNHNFPPLIFKNETT